MGPAVCRDVSQNLTTCLFAIVGLQIGEGPAPAMSLSAMGEPSGDTSFWAEAELRRLMKDKRGLRRKTRRSRSTAQVCEPCPLEKEARPQMSFTLLSLAHLGQTHTAGTRNRAPAKNQRRHEFLTS